MSEADGKGRRTRRRPEDLRTRIVAAAAETFRAQGYGGATTAAIARAAAVTEAQLFRYFGSKANLFREAVFDPIDRHLTQFNGAGGEAFQASFDSATLSYVEQLKTFITENSAALLSVRAAQRVSSEFSPAESLNAYFDHGVELLQTRPDSMSMDPKIAVRIAFASVLGAALFRDWLFPAEHWTEDQISEGLNEFILRSIDPD